MSQPEGSERSASAGAAPPGGLPGDGAKRVRPALLGGLGLAALLVVVLVLASGTTPQKPTGTSLTSTAVAESTPSAPPATAPTAPTTAPVTAPNRSGAGETQPTPTTRAPSPSTSTSIRAAAADPATASPTSDTNCGGQATVTVGGQQWPCAFDEEFNGTSLDSSKWVVQETADGGYHSGLECFENDPANVSVSDGTLHLTAEQISSFFCPGDPPYETQYTSGMVSTYQRFTQTDGLFEVRAKVSDAAVQGLQSSFWLYPAQPTYGAWPASGEIDIAELFSEYPTLAIPFVHYNNDSNDPEATNDHCVIGDPSQFQTYAVAWTPQSLTFLYDGQTCLVDHWSSAAPLADPAPFNEPFYLCLTQALGIGTNQFLAGSTPLPATTSVDWVRVWGAQGTG